MNYRVTIDGKDYTIRFEERDDGLYALIDGRAVKVKASSRTGAAHQRMTLDGREIDFGYSRGREGIEVVIAGEVYQAKVGDARSMRYASVAGAAGTRKKDAVKAPMPGLVVSVLVKAGDSVKKGQSLLTLNAMKLENDIRSPGDGKIAAVHVTPNQPVEKGTALVTLE